MRLAFSTAAVAVLFGLCCAQNFQTPLAINVSEGDPSKDGWLLEILKQYDVVELMKMTGHGDGLDEMRLVRMIGEEIDTPLLVTEGEKLRMKKAGRNFMDVTDHPDLGKLNAQRKLSAAASTTPYIPVTAPNSSLKALMANLDDKYLRSDIAKLTSFWNRNYRSPFGGASSEWLFSQVDYLTKASTNSASKLSTRKVKHDFPQSTVIARIESADSNVSEEDKEIVILGAHQDSLNYELPFYRAPGADDDGSGTVTILQVFRSLVEDKFVPPADVAVEFHWYAGEEGGLLGSLAVAAEYEKAEKKIKGMLQMDMTAFLKNGTEPIIAIFTDVMDEGLKNFTTNLVDAYLPIGWSPATLPPRAGSDHMAWHRAGYPVLFVAEALFENFQHDVHTTKDDTDSGGQYSFDHMLDFVKLGIAFVAELAIASHQEV